MFFSLLFNYILLSFFAFSIIVGLFFSFKVIKLI